MRQLTLLWWVVGTTVIDQLSKLAVQTTQPDWVVLNRAVAFSLPVPTWVTGIALLLLVGLAAYEWYHWPAQVRPVRVWSLGLLIGGAISNIIDRLAVGAVRDFIDVRIWPVFNLADVALTLGTIAIIWYSLRSSHLQTSHGEQPNPSQSERHKLPRRQT